MRASTLKKGGSDSITQFSIYAANRVGKLNDLLGLFGANDIHIMAISSIDNTDTSVVRIVVDCVDELRALLLKKNVPFNEVDVIGVELESEEQLKFVTCALVQAEINIHYIYPFLIRPNGKLGVIISVEDKALSKEILSKNKIKLIRKSDITR